MEKVPALLPPRSLLIMCGPARYLWSHGIATRLYDQVPDEQDGALTITPRGTRISVTFRTVRESPQICNCGRFILLSF